jgi:tRNA-modifying protein YgfZ
MRFEDTELADRAVVSITGADAPAFLQGLVTADVLALTPGAAAYAALLTPQGKMLFDFFVLRREDGYWLDAARAQLPELTKRLKMYKLRAKVEIAEMPELKVTASALHGDIADPRLAEMGFRSYTLEATPSRDAGYHAHRIGLGLADSQADLGQGEYFPHEANLDQLGGLSFSKGCYVGQEVVSRMEHRGTARSRMLPVTIAGGAPAKGTEIVADGKPLGTVLSSAGEGALALMRLDRLKEARTAPVAEGRPVRVMKPSWVRYEV